MLLAAPREVEMLAWIIRVRAGSRLGNPEPIRAASAGRRDSCSRRAATSRGSTLVIAKSPAGVEGFVGGLRTAVLDLGALPAGLLCKQLEIDA